MSRIGRAPVIFDKDVQVTVNPNNEVIVKGPKTTETIKMKPEIKAEVKGQEVVFTRTSEEKNVRALHGLYRSLVQNAVIGVSKGFTKVLELNGVGYRAGVKGKQLELTLGFSHPVVYDIPAGIEVKVEKQTTVSISGSNKDTVGQVASDIREFRLPEPYLGKGIKYQDEQIRRKAGKTAGK